MKLPPFAYAAPGTLEEAVALLGGRGDAAVLAGGQSLLLEMRYGEAAPGLLVDVNGVAGLDRLVVDAGELHVGATVRHAALEHLPPSVGAGALGRLLRLAAPAVGHPPIRSRGTFTGSIAWAHPSAEWCALAVLADAAVDLHGPDGARSVTADAWFTGAAPQGRTARRPGEVVTAVRVPLLPEGAGVGFVEHRRTHASFALVAALAAVTLDAGGRVAQARLAVAGAGPAPLRARAAEALLAGAAPGPAALAAAADATAAASDPLPEPHASPRYRRHAAGVVARRALEQAVDDATARRAGQEEAA